MASFFILNNTFTYPISREKVDDKKGREIIKKIYTPVYAITRVSPTSSTYFTGLSAPLLKKVYFNSTNLAWV